MKKFVISGVLVLAVLMVSRPALSQPAQADEQREQYNEMRRKWQDMSEEEREKARAEIRERNASRGLGSEGQLKVIALIEEQVAKLKAAVKSIAQGRDRYQNMSEEERTEYRKKMAQIARTRRDAIEEVEQQLSKLKFREQRRQQAVEPQTRVKELQEIHQLAVKEKATETAKRLEALIAGYKQRQPQAPGIEPGPREGREQSEPRLREPKSEESK